MKKQGTNGPDDIRTKKFGPQCRFHGTIHPHSDANQHQISKGRPASGLELRKNKSGSKRQNIVGDEKRDQKSLSKQYIAVLSLIIWDKSRKNCHKSDKLYTAV